MMSAMTSAGRPAFAGGSAKGAVWAEAADAAASAASAPPQYSPFIISLSPNRRPHPLRPLFSLESLQLLAIDLDADAWPFGQPERMIVLVGRRVADILADQHRPDRPSAERQSRKARGKMPVDRKSHTLQSRHSRASSMPSSACKKK